MPLLVPIMFSISNIIFNIFEMFLDYLYQNHRALTHCSVNELIATQEKSPRGIRNRSQGALRAADRRLPRGSGR